MDDCRQKYVSDVNLTRSHCMYHLPPTTVVSFERNVQVISIMRSCLRFCQTQNFMYVTYGCFSLKLLIKPCCLYSYNFCCCFFKNYLNTPIYMHNIEYNFEINSQVYTYYLAGINTHKLLCKVDLLT